MSIVARTLGHTTRRAAPVARQRHGPTLMQQAIPPEHSLLKCAMCMPRRHISRSTIHMRPTHLRWSRTLANSSVRRVRRRGEGVLQVQDLVVNPSELRIKPSSRRGRTSTAHAAHPGTGRRHLGDDRWQAARVLLPHDAGRVEHGRARKPAAAAEAAHASAAAFRTSRAGGSVGRCGLGRRRREANGTSSCLGE